MKLPELLLVDDDEVFRKRLKRAFSERGYPTWDAWDFHSGVNEALKHRPTWAILDLRMPGKSGLSLTKELKKIFPTIRILVLTGFGSISTAIEAIKAGAHHYLTKPCDADEILRVLQGIQLDSNSFPKKNHLVPSLARVEWEHIQRILNICHGNISKASKLLGIHRRSLQRKLAKNPPKG